MSGQGPTDIDRIVARIRKETGLDRVYQATQVAEGEVARLFKEVTHSPLPPTEEVAQTLPTWNPAKLPPPLTPVTPTQEEPFSPTGLNFLTAEQIAGLLSSVQTQLTLVQDTTVYLPDGSPDLSGPPPPSVITTWFGGSFTVPFRINGKSGYWYLSPAEFPVTTTLGTTLQSAETVVLPTPSVMYALTEGSITTPVTAGGVTAGSPITLNLTTLGGQPFFVLVIANPSALNTVVPPTVAVADSQGNTFTQVAGQAGVPVLFGTGVTLALFSATPATGANDTITVTAGIIAGGLLIAIAFVGYSVIDNIGNTQLNTTGLGGSCSCTTESPGDIIVAYSYGQHVPAGFAQAATLDGLTVCTMTSMTAGTQTVQYAANNVDFFGCFSLRGAVQAIQATPSGELLVSASVSAGSMTIVEPVDSFGGLVVDLYGSDYGSPAAQKIVQVDDSGLVHTASLDVGYDYNGFSINPPVLLATGNGFYQNPETYPSFGTGSPFRVDGLGRLSVEATSVGGMNPPQVVWWGSTQGSATASLAINVPSVGTLRLNASATAIYVFVTITAAGAASPTVTDTSSNSYTLVHSDTTKVDAQTFIYKVSGPVAPATPTVTVAAASASINFTVLVVTGIVAAFTTSSGNVNGTGTSINLTSMSSPLPPSPFILIAQVSLASQQNLNVSGTAHLLVNTYSGGPNTVGVSFQSFEYPSSDELAGFSWTTSTDFSGYAIVLTGVGGGGGLWNIDTMGSAHVYLDGPVDSSGYVLVDVASPAPASTATGSITTTVTAVKASAGTLLGWYLFNSNSVTVYCQIFDLATGSVSLGTTAPKLSFGIPAGLGANLGFMPGIKFSTAISVAFTTTRAGSTAPANTVDFNFWFN